MFNKLLISFLSVFFINSLLFGNERISRINNIVQNIKGSVFYKNHSGKISKLENGFGLNTGDVIYTGIGSSLDIHFEDKSVLSIGSLSVVLVDDLLSAQKPGQSNIRYKSKFKLKLGSVKADVKRRAGDLKQFEVQTPVGVASVRGTEKEVSYFRDSGMSVRVLHGKVLVSSNRGISKSVVKGEKTTATKSATPSFQKEIEAEEDKVFKVSNDSASGSKEFKDIVSNLSKNIITYENQEIVNKVLLKSYRAKMLSDSVYSIDKNKFASLKDYQKKLWDTSKSINNGKEYVMHNKYSLK